MRTTVGCVVLVALAAVACGAEPTLSRQTAEALAGRADRIAELAEQGLDCEAVELTRQLRVRTIDGRRDGDVPGEIADEIVATTDELITELSCREDTAPTPTETAPEVRTEPPAPPPGPPGPPERTERTEPEDDEQTEPPPPEETGTQDGEGPPGEGPPDGGDGGDGDDGGDGGDGGNDG